jgi:hypothetical protein
MKKVLIIGCSNGIGIDYTFKKVFGYEHNYTNLSASGFGNRYITARLFEYVDEIGIPDYVYLQYSGLSRIDIPLDVKVTVPDYEFQVRTKKRNWVASGGRNGSWMICEMLKKFFTYMYDTTSDICQYDLSLHEIFRGIELCKTLKIKYNWTSWYDYTNPLSASARIDGFVEKIPAYIDLSNHIGDYPLNLAYELNQPPSDGCHYGKSIFEKFLIKNKNKFNL